MSYDQNYPFPQVFLVDGGGSQQNPDQPPSLVPCWSFPPAQERVRSRGKSQGCMGVSHGAALVVLMLFLLVFATLGFGAYQIHTMQKKIRDLPKVKPETEFNSPQMQIGFDEPGLKGEDTEDRHAAHVIGELMGQVQIAEELLCDYSHPGRIEYDMSKKLSETLRWDPWTGPAFTSGAVAYRIEDGGLQVNKSGLYHIYSRVELTFKDCSSLLHSVFVRRAGHAAPVKLMEANRAGFCSQQLGHSWTTESYLGSALQLHKYDRVYVNVSHPRLLSHRHYNSFFGLYKI